MVTQNYLHSFQIDKIPNKRIFKGRQTVFVLINLLESFCSFELTKHPLDNVITLSIQTKIKQTLKKKLWKENVENSRC